MNLFVLGRQPEIGLAELTAVFGHDVSMFGTGIALSQTDFRPEFKPDFLGSSIKVAKVVHRIGSADFRRVSQELVKFYAANLPPTGKLTIGISAHGFRNTSTRDVGKTGLILKSKLKGRDGSVRLISGETSLSSAVVLHNGLAKGANKREIIVATDGTKSVIAETFHIQDINSYTFRDRSRPKRDAFVGMLPPKLAQTMVNLAVSQKDCAGKTLLDPFCGTGVVLQEAALMGVNVYGTDLSEKMVDYTSQNLDWLRKTHRIEFSQKVEPGDATDYKWNPKPDFVACETYLGQPFSAEPSVEKLRENIGNCNVIITKFLRNLAQQITPETGACVAVPAWFISGRVYHLPVLDELSQTGFERIEIARKSLIYHRPEQIVGREILVLRKS